MSYLSIGRIDQLARPWAPDAARGSAALDGKAPVGDEALALGVEAPQVVHSEPDSIRGEGGEQPQPGQLGPGHDGYALHPRRWGRAGGQPGLVTAVVVRWPVPAFVIGPRLAVLVEGVDDVGEGVQVQVGSLGSDHHETGDAVDEVGQLGMPAEEPLGT